MSRLNPYMVPGRWLPLLALALLLCGSSIAQASHPFHVSLSEIERNSTTGNFEVSLCIWPADLEKALSRMEDKSLDLDQVENLDELISQYLNKTVQFTSADGTRAKIRFVGHEMDLQKGWLYFEVQTGKKAQAWNYRNQVFFELNDDQINHFNFKAPKQLISKACTVDQPAYDLP